MIALAKTRKIALIMLGILGLFLLFYVIVIVKTLQNREQYFRISYEITLSEKPFRYNVPLSFKRNYKRTVIRVICKNSNLNKGNISKLKIYVKLNSNKMINLSKVNTEDNQNDIFLFYDLPVEIIKSLETIVFSSDSPIEITDIDLFNYCFSKEDNRGAVHR